MYFISTEHRTRTTNRNYVNIEFNQSKNLSKTGIIEQRNKSPGKVMASDSGLSQKFFWMEKFKLYTLLKFATEYYSPAPPQLDSRFSSPLINHMKNYSDAHEHLISMQYIE